MQIGTSDPRSKDMKRSTSAARKSKAEVTFGCLFFFYVVRTSLYDSTYQALGCCIIAQHATVASTNNLRADILNTRCKLICTDTFSYE